VQTTVKPEQIPEKAGSYTVRFAVQDEPATHLDVTFIVDDDRVALTYYGNGATSGTPPATTLHQAGTPAVVADQGDLRRSGYSFGGWALTSNGGAAYQAGQTFKIYEDVRLYAVWNQIPTPPVPPPPPPPPTVIVSPPPPPSVIVQPPVVVPGPGATNVVEVPVPTPYEVQVPGPTAPDASRPSKSLKDKPVPRSTTSDKTWSLVSLLLSLIAFMAVVALTVASFRHRREDERAVDDEDLRRRLNRIRLFTAVICLLGLVPALVFFILDSVTARMVLINAHTVFVVIAFAVVSVLIAIRLIVGRSLADDDDDDDRRSGTSTGGYIA
jgi:hypothetical protein